MFSNNFIKLIKKDFEKISCKILKSFWRRKRKKWQYGCEQFKSLPKYEKEKLAECRKKYYKMRKNSLS